MLYGIKFVDKTHVEQSLKEERKQKDKEKKRLKKEKKKAKKEHKRHKREPSSASEADDKAPSASAEGEVAAEAVSAARDDWMAAALGGRNVLTGEVKKADDEATAAPEETAKPKVSAKELNAFFRDGGDGLPPEDAAKPVTNIVGDGGASWRLKALKRAQERAAEEGKSTNEVVAERWGSIPALTAGLAPGSAAHPRAHLHSSRDRERAREPGEREGERAGDGNKQGRDGGGRAAYLKDVGSARSQMRRPSESLSWRSGRGGRDAGRASQTASREAGRSDRAAHRTGPRARDPLGRREDAAILREAAGAMNAFADDGSFLERFGSQAADVVPEAETPGVVDAEALEGLPDEAAPSSSEQEVRESPLVTSPSHNVSSSHADTPASDETPLTGNKGAAAALRAKLLGRGNAAPVTSPSTGEEPSAKRRREVTVLPAVDAAGRALPGNFGREAAGEGLIDGGRKPKKLQRYDEAGDKRRYFADDDDRDLDALVRQTRHEGAEDMDANLASNIARRSRFKEKELDVDEEYDVDGGLSLYERRDRQGTKEKAQVRQRRVAIADHRRMTSALDACALCFASAKRAKHLTIAIGQTSYLALPERGRLVPDHCCIIPIEHVSSARATDEHVWAEMRNFKKALIQMCMAQGTEAVFLETAVRLGDARSHAAVHCVPLPSKAASKAPMFFKQAIDESESEWSQHHAKRLIDTSAKGLRGSIPVNFPYFHVEFGLSRGFVHVIDDEAKFDPDFGRSIMAGLLALPAEALKRGQRGEGLAVQQKLVANFLKGFQPFDWTAQL